MRALTTILILLSFNCIGQIKPFSGVSFSNIGYSLQGGIQSKNRVLTIGYSVPLRSANNPTLVFIMAGNDFDLEKNYYLTALAGYSLTGPISSVELSKQFYKGRLVVNVNYCKVFFAGAGFKIFII